MDPRQTLFQRQIRLDLERRRLQLDEESFQIQQELEALEQQQGSGYPDSEDSGTKPFSYTASFLMDQP